METSAENNVVRFTSITKKKEGFFVNFRVKGIRNGALFSTSISVNLEDCDVHIGEDSLEKVIKEAARVAVREFKKAEPHFEGLKSV